MEKRVTLRDVAARVGLHFSTVALALKNDPRIRRTTRERVMEAARKMGYVPDPMASALAVYRNAIRPPAFQGVLAWLSCSEAPEIRPGYLFQKFFEGAQARASELGYRIEEFALRSPGVTANHLVRMLNSRGITGILVAPQPPGTPSERIEIDWSFFSAVAIGPSLSWPSLHRVGSNYFQGVKMAMRHLADLGYRKIGLYLDQVANQRGEGAWMAGYWFEQKRLGLEIIEPLVLKTHHIGQVADWIREQKLEAVLGPTGQAAAAAQLLGWRVPEDFAHASLHVFEGEAAREAGINHNDHAIGEAAVNLLVGAMHRRERGIPAFAQSILIDGTWQPGHSVGMGSGR